MPRPPRFRRFLPLAFLLATVAAAAEPTWHLSLQLYSLHEHTTQTDLTNNTPGIGIMRVTEDNWLAGAGVFRNSLARTAGYAYVGKEWAVNRPGRHRQQLDAALPISTTAALCRSRPRWSPAPLADRWALDLIGIPRASAATPTTRCTSPCAGSSGDWSPPLGLTAARTISSLTLQPRAAAVRVSVVSVIEVFAGSRIRFNAARLVSRVFASSESVSPLRSIWRRSATAIACLSRAASASQ